MIVMPGLVALASILLQLPMFANPQYYSKNMYEPMVSLIAQHSVLDQGTTEIIKQRIRQVITPEDIEAMVAKVVAAVKGGTYDATAHGFVVDTTALKTEMISRSPEIFNRMPICTELDALQKAAFPWCVPPATPEVTNDEIKTRFVNFIQTEVPAVITIQGADQTVVSNFRMITDSSYYVLGIILVFCIMLFISHWLFLGSNSKALLSTGIVYFLTGTLIYGIWYALLDLPDHLDKISMFTPFQLQLLTSLIGVPLPTFRLFSFAFLSLGIVFIGIRILLNNYDSQKTSL